MHEEESAEQKAIRLLKRQLDELHTIRGLNYLHAEFKAWRDSTKSILDRLLGPEEQLSKRFLNLRFFGSQIIVPYGGSVPPANYISPEDAEAFRSACETSDATLRAAIRHIEDFGVHVAEAKPMPSGRGRGKGGGVSQNFHGPVSIQNLAIAAGSAVQKIAHMGDKTGVSLREIAELLQQSEELSPRQVKEGLAQIETVAVEVAKPEVKRNWKMVVEGSTAILDLTNKATDLASRIAPYTPAIIALLDQARHYLK